MKVDLSNVLSDLTQNSKTGLLSISVSDTNRLFKIYFKKGEIYRLGFGPLKGAECLAQFDELEFKASFFLPDIEVAGEPEKIPSTSEVVTLFKMADRSVEMKQPETSSPHMSNNGSPVSNLPRMLDDLKAALIEQIGPVGIKVFQRTVDEKWRSGSFATRHDLEKLISMLKDVIEDAGDRQTFLNASNKIISE